MVNWYSECEKSKTS